MSTTRKKKRNANSTSQPPQSPAPAPNPLIPGLPDDVAVNCLTRVPRWHHPFLSVVSKPIRSLLSSPQFFAERSLLNCTNHVLYINIAPNNTDLSTNWYTLDRRYSIYDEKKKKNQFFLTPIPSSPSKLRNCAYAVVGTKLFVIGGDIVTGDGENSGNVPSSDVWILDCRFHTWERGPSMGLPRSLARTVVLEDKIYVFGGRKWVQDSKLRALQFAEVFDPAIGCWEVVPAPGKVFETVWVVERCGVVCGKVCVFCKYGNYCEYAGLVYDPRTKTWKLRRELNICSKCEVDGVLFKYDYFGTIVGYDERNGKKKELIGILQDLPEFGPVARMANVGGRLFVQWNIGIKELYLDDSDYDEEEKGSDDDDYEVKGEMWCAEIEVSKTMDGELRGKVLWADKLPLRDLENGIAFDWVSVAL
ncbi:hypothetical protein UlMin_038716 [Ulmus minor]